MGTARNGPAGRSEGQVGLSLDLDYLPALGRVFSRAPRWLSSSHSPLSVVRPQGQSLRPHSRYLGAATSWAHPVPFSWPIFPGLNVPMFIPLSQGGTRVGAGTYRWSVHIPVLKATPGKGWSLGGRRRSKLMAGPPFVLLPWPEAR